MDNSSRIRMLIMDLMDKGEILMCSVIREKSGSFLLKLRVDEFNDQQDGSVGGVSLNSNVHFRRKSQRQYDRDINRADKHNNDSNQSHISSRTRSKKELSRSDHSSESTDVASRPYFYGVASPDACLEPCSPSPSEEQQTVSVNDSPNPLDLASIKANVNTACDSSIHRVDSFMTEESAVLTENTLTACDDMISSEEITAESIPNASLITPGQIEIPTVPNHSDTSQLTLAHWLRRDLDKHRVFELLREDTRNLSESSDIT